LLQLYRRVVPHLIAGAIDPLDYEVFQSLFGALFTMLIAMGFKHCRVSRRKHRKGSSMVYWLLRDHASQEPLKQLP